MTKSELIAKMKTVNTWKELGLTVSDVCTLLDNDENNRDNSWEGRNNGNGENVEQELRDKIKRLTDTNKQLRAENKALKGERR